MVGTLVVTLPSGYTGGELMVGHNEEWKAYRGSKTALSLVAFYADCRHEVLRVNSGYRMTLTYNLLLHGDTSRPEGDDGTAAELAGPAPRALQHAGPRDYWRTRGRPAATGWSTSSTTSTPRAALSWPRLKGAGRDAGWPCCGPRRTRQAARPYSRSPTSRRRTARSRRTKTTDTGDAGWYDDYDEYDDDEDPGGASDSEREYDIQELIDSEITLTHWTGPDGSRLEETSLSGGRRRGVRVDQDRRPRGILR